MKDTASFLIDGRSVTIRPIQIADQPLEKAFIKNLSAQTKHYRFFGAVNDLPAREIRGFCTVDGHDSMAYVAIVTEEGKEVEIGVCRYAPCTDAKTREMAVTIADQWQHTDLDRKLMDHLIETARQNGVRELYAVELSDNRAMKDFAHKLGMSVRGDPQDNHQVIYTLSLQ